MKQFVSSQMLGWSVIGWQSFASKTVTLLNDYSKFILVVNEREREASKCTGTR